MAVLILGTCAGIASADFNLTLTHDYAGGNFTYELSWDAVQPSTTSAVVTYYVYQEFGKDAVNIGTPAQAIFNTVQTQAAIEYYPGSRCFVVMSSDSVTGQTEFSDRECHGFVHDLTSESLLRKDGDGTQRGIDQTWTFTYSLDHDAYVTAQIYPPGTQFTRDANNFVISASSPAVKTLVDYTPRSGELATHDITNEETWDSRSSTGVVVPNGIYYLLMKAQLDSGFFTGTPPNESTVVAVPEDLVRDSEVFSIPVDILRIMDLKATGISLSSPKSSISYTLTGDANVRVVIAKPGSAFTVDNNGDVQPMDRTSGLIDSSLIVSSFTFQRKAGSNTESWDGTSSTGAVMGSGVYPVGISATDDYGNHAIAANGDDFPNFTTITLERSVGSDTGPSGGGNTDTTPPTLSSISPADGSTQTGPQSTIVVVLADSQSSLNLSGSAIAVHDPNNALVPGTVTNNGKDTLTFTASSQMDQSGVYTVTVTAFDNSGNSQTFTRTFGINVKLDSSALKSSMLMYPNPAKATTVHLVYDVSTAATTKIAIFNMMGEKVYEASYDDPQGSVNHDWDLKGNSGKKVGSGLYLVRIKASGASGEAEAVKKLVVVQ